MRHLRTSSILGACLTGAFFLGAAPVHAEVSISVSPALIELDGHAGDSGRIEVSVGNGGDETFEVLATLTSFQDMTGDRSLVEWSTVTPERQVLEPGEDGSVELSIEIPDEVASGGRYASLSLSTVSPGEDGSAGLAGGIVVPVFLSVAGEGDREQLPVLERAALFLEPDGSLGARVAVRNDGNVHVPLTGSVELTARGQDLDESLGIPMGRVLPGTTRTYSSDATVPLSLASTYDVVVSMGLPDESDAMGEAVINDAFEVDAVPSLDMNGLTICENLDRGLSLTASLVNDGSLGIVPTVIFRFVDEAGSSVGSTRASGQPLVWPNETIDVHAELSDPLASGSFVMVASATFGLDSRVESRLPFTIGGDPATAAPVCDASSSPSQPAG